MSEQDTTNITTDIIFRRATVKDAEAMDGLNRRCLPENYPLMEWKTILTMMPSLSYVAYIGDTLVGYCLSMSTLDRQKGTIASIAVDQSYRRKGIGKELLLRSIDGMTKMGLHIVSLNVRISNISAQTLYKQMGFRKHQLLQRYYQNGEDAYLMRKVLS